MPNLFPEDNTIEEEFLNNQEVIGYKKSIYFDSQIGDFLRDGSQSLIECSEQEAWIQWCEKCLNTPKFSCLAYSDNYGIDTIEVFSSNDREEIETLLTTEISEALMKDPYGRTSYVSFVEFNWLEADCVEVTCEVVGIDSSINLLSTTIVR